MNDEEKWQMGGVKSYEVIDQTAADSDLSMSAGSVEIDNVKFDTDNGELTIDHVKCHWSDIYTIPLDEVPRLIEYLQGISQNAQG